MKYFLIILFSFYFYCFSAQKVTDPVASRIITEMDTLNMSFLPGFEIVVDDDAYKKKYKNTKYYVKRVYAYSQIASNMLLSFQDTLETIESKRKRKKYLNRANKMLKEEFGDEIKNMSITRGNYLMKLIYRETKMSTFEIIQMYRGNGQAIWYQTLCKINGQDLKKIYDPEGDDMMIEKVVSEIEDGEYSYLKRLELTEAAKKAKILIEKAKKDKRKNKKKIRKNK